MAASKSGFMKDALILCAITLVSGLCLGVVYDVTKAPIEAATIAANNATYKQVLPEAESFDDVEGSTEKIAETADEIANLGFGGVAIESVLEAKDASGAVVGHVINSLSNDSYGGAVKLSIGFDADGAITGVGIRETSDTPGLGLKAKDDDYRNQYVGKNCESLKSGSASDTEINAISGATITSNATTNAVNAALYYLHNCLN